MELVTGRWGEPHITSEQDRQKHQGVWGGDGYILKTGNELEAEVQSSNNIRIKDGAMMYQGALMSVKVGTYDTVTINNGNQGMKRKDLIVARYTYNASSKKESAEWKVIQGTPKEENPVAPTPTSGNIQEGDNIVDCPVFAVTLDGINITGVEALIEKAPTIPELKEMIDSLNSKIPVESENYVKLPDGTLYQWGTVASKSGGNGVAFITFPVRFASSDYAILLTPLYPNSSYPVFDVSAEHRTGVNNASANVYFRTQAGGALTGASADWLAIGKWK